MGLIPTIQAMYIHFAIARGFRSLAAPISSRPLSARLFCVSFVWAIVNALSAHPPGHVLILRCLRLLRIPVIPTDCGPSKVKVLADLTQRTVVYRFS